MQKLVKYFLGRSIIYLLSVTTDRVDHSSPTPDHPPTCPWLSTSDFRQLDQSTYIHKVPSEYYPWVEPSPVPPTELKRQLLHTRHHWVVQIINRAAHRWYLLIFASIFHNPIKAINKRTFSDTPIVNCDVYIMKDLASMTCVDRASRSTAQQWLLGSHCTGFWKHW